MNGVDNVLASTVFTPTGAAPVVQFYSRNFTGFPALIGTATPNDAPLRVGPGHYQVSAEGSFINFEMSIAARAYNAAGTTRFVSVVPSAPLGNRTLFDIFIRTDVADALSDDALFVEVTVRRLPL